MLRPAETNIRVSSAFIFLGFKPRHQHLGAHPLPRPLGSILSFWINSEQPAQITADEEIVISASLMEKLNLNSFCYNLNAICKSVFGQLPAFQPAVSGALSS